MASTQVIVPPTKFVVLVDTREKPNHRLFQPGLAPKEDNPIIEYKLCALKTGDYTIEGLDNFIVVERKAHGNEFCSNLIRERERTMRLFDRMKAFKYKWIVFGQTYEEFCDPCNWPGVNNPMNSMAVVEGWLIALASQDIHFNFAGKFADRWVRRLLIKKYNDERKRIREFASKQVT